MKCALLVASISSRLLVLGVSTYVSSQVARVAIIKKKRSATLALFVIGSISLKCTLGLHWGNFAFLGLCVAFDA